MTFVFLGNLIFLLIFQFKLHEINDLSTRNRLRQIKTALFIILAFGIVWERFGHVLAGPGNISQNDITVALIAHIIRTIILFILLPKYYINQNPNFKLYLSIYHQQPPPVLPWQLPENFDTNGIHLIIADLPS